MALLQVFAPGRPVHARRIGPADQGFLQALYASTRAQELACTGWPPERQRAFLDTQFGYQQRYYAEHYADAEFLLLSHGHEAIGRLLWQDTAHASTLIDISLLPAWRGRGLGSGLLATLCGHADAAGRPVGLHVEPDNPARRLYTRFGFEVTADNGVHLKMRRPPQSRSKSAEAVG